MLSRSTCLALQHSRATTRSPAPNRKCIITRLPSPLDSASEGEHRVQCPKVRRIVYHQCLAILLIRSKDLALRRASHPDRRSVSSRLALSPLSTSGDRPLAVRPDQRSASPLSCGAPPLYTELRVPETCDPTRNQPAYLHRLGKSPYRAYEFSSVQTTVHFPIHHGEHAMPSKIMRIVRPVILEASAIALSALAEKLRANAKRKRSKRSD